MSYQLFGARLVVARATIETVELLEGEGIPSVVLRGPILTGWLYGESARASLDVDLLVPNLEVASAVLQRAGYERLVDWTPGMERHAWTHVREGHVTVDLHRTLVGVPAAPERVWHAFSAVSERLELVGGVVTAPSRHAQLAVVALHAAQHGEHNAKTLADIARAVAIGSEAEWEEALVFAREIGAVRALALGVSLVPPGHDLLARLGVDPPGRSVRAAATSPTAIGLERLLTLRGRQRWRYLLGKVFPPAAFMRDWSTLARRGRIGLLAAYAFRVAWAARWLPKGASTVVRNRRDG